MLLVPDDDLALVYWEQVAPYARRGSLLLFARAASPEIDELPEGVDVATIAMNEDGCLASVQQDATSQARSSAHSTICNGSADKSSRPTSSQRPRPRPNDPFPHPMRRVL